MKLKVVLKTTNKHSERVGWCLNSWLGGLDYVCMTDRPTGMFEELSCGVQEDYMSAEEKTCNFFMKVRDGLFSEYDWLAFVDDDAVMDHVRVKEMLASLDSHMVHGLNMQGAWPDDKSLVYPSGGAGYFVSPSLVRSMSPMKILGVGIEDVRVGMWMKENGISLGNSMPLNGWFPIMEAYESLWMAEGVGGDVEKIFLSFSDEQRKRVQSKITHHYVRGSSTMRCLHLMQMDRNIDPSWPSRA